MKTDKILSLMWVTIIVAAFFSIVIIADNLTKKDKNYPDKDYPVLAFPETMDIGPYHFVKTIDGSDEIWYFAECDIYGLTDSEEDVLENKIESIIRKNFKSKRYSYYASVRNDYGDKRNGIRITIRDHITQEIKRTEERIEEDRKHKELLDKYVNF